VKIIKVSEALIHTNDYVDKIKPADRILVFTVTKPLKIILNFLDKLPQQIN